MKKFCVIGLGRFGYEVATNLARNHMDVLAVDSNETIIDSIKDSVTQAVCMRIIGEESLRNIGIEEIDVVVVAIGENFAQSILITALLKQKIGTKSVIVRSISELHKEVLELIGAEYVILPEQAMGQRLAEQLCLTARPLTPITEHYSFATLKAPDYFIGKTIGELDLHDSYQIQLLGKKVGDDVVSLDKNDRIVEGDTLVIAGSNDHLKKVMNF